MSDLQEASRRIAAARGELRACAEAAARQKSEAHEVAAKLRVELEASRTNATGAAADLLKTREELATTRGALATSDAGRFKSDARAEMAEKGLSATAKEQGRDRQRIAELENAVAESRTETEGARAEVKEKARLLADAHAEAVKAHVASQAREKELAGLIQRVATLDKQLAEAVASRSKAEEAAKENGSRLAASSSETKRLADALSAKDAETKARAQELASAREEAAAKLKAVDSEAASKLAASDKALTSARSDLDSRLKEIENLQHQVAEARDARQLATSKDGSGNAATVQSDLEKARAEIVRLNDANLEQQALIDELSSTGKSSPDVRPAKSRSHRDEATRARKAPPIAQVSLKVGDGVAEGNRVNPSSLSDELARALGRRETLERTIEKLKGSPADPAAPGKAAEMQAELAVINKEVLRLTILVSDLPSHPPR